jgi:hypothetical protein
MEILMKSITLFGPTIVMGKVRHAYENPLVVSNREATRLKTAGVLASDPEDAAGDDPVEPGPEPDSGDGTPEGEAA